ncbi:hypothetical protein [Dokdonia sp. MED134]|uniref:hypothetical protein n=1 Tax=Dokdonia sp. MED134 TaxID=313590 RepID=UPI0000689BB1|nr:hypothetical protein [Dokdonia sp. MED134]
MSKAPSLVPLAIYGITALLALVTLLDFALPGKMYTEEVSGRKLSSLKLDLF